MRARRLQVTVGGMMGAVASAALATHAWLQGSIRASPQEKAAFRKFLAGLPVDHEFLAAEGVEKALPHTRVLLALDERDVKDEEIYPFVALSRGLLDHRDQREYGARHFGEIAHPTIKLFWAVILFEEGPATPEIVRYLRSALASPEQSKVLSPMLGPEFPAFRRRVAASPLR